MNSIIRLKHIGFLLYFLANLLFVPTITYHTNNITSNMTSQKLEFLDPIISHAQIIHNSIYIDEDIDFVQQGWPGNGTLDDPYRIEDLSVNPNSTQRSCITIRDTRVHFTIRNCILMFARTILMFEGKGLYLRNVSNAVIIDNLISNNDHGVIIEASRNNLLINNTCRWNYLEGIELSDYSQFNNLTENLCENNQFGIRFKSGSDLNFLINNTCSNNYGTDIDINDSEGNVIQNNTFQITPIGLRLNSSHENIISNNTYLNNDLGIVLANASENSIIMNTFVGCGLYPSDVGDTTFQLQNYRQFQVTGNTVNGRPLVFWQDQVDTTVPPNAGQIILLGCNNIIIDGQSPNNCTTGIFLLFTNDSTLIHNTCTDSIYGIQVSRGSEKNTINWNTLVNNTYNAWDDGANNTFIYNFYSNYQGADENDDGIGDIPYEVWGLALNIDPFPLMTPALRFLPLQVNILVILFCGLVSVFIIIIVLVSFKLFRHK